MFSSVFTPEIFRRVHVIVVVLFNVYVIVVSCPRPCSKYIS